MTEAMPIAESAPADWPKTGETIAPAAFGPFGPARLAGYALASGDDNPIHLDPAAAVAVGLEAPPVHGMLMMSCFEPALRRWRGDIVVTSLSGKFLRPISVGGTVAITGRVARSSLAPHPELLLRLKAQGPNGELAILAEATVRLAAVAP
jgi:acyl dehydratase